MSSTFSLFFVLKKELRCHAAALQKQLCQPWGSLSRWAPSEQQPFWELALGIAPGPFFAGRSNKVQWFPCWSQAISSIPQSLGPSTRGRLGSNPMAPGFCFLVGSDPPEVASSAPASGPFAGSRCCRFEGPSWLSGSIFDLFAYCGLVVETQVHLINC